MRTEQTARAAKTEQRGQRGRGERRAFSNPLRALWRLLAVSLVSFYFFLSYHLTRPFLPKGVSTLPRSLRYTHRWTRGLLRVLGWKVRVEGNPPPQGSLLAPNHMGHADIVAISSAIPTFFVAKAEVAGWPVVGYLFRKAEHIIVTREGSRELPATIGEIQKRLEAGFNVCIFLEGTSTGGDRVLPFFPALAQPAIAAGAPLVPMAIRWRPRDRRIDVSEDIAYWKEEHVFAPHAWRLIGFKGIEVEVAFGDPILPQGRKRGELAEQARRRVLELTGLGRAPD